MNLEDLNNLDFKNTGSWPLVARIALIVVIFVAVVGAGYWFDIKKQQANLAQLESKETTLKHEFEFKAARAANLQAYRDQLEDMRKTFGTLLRQLPGKTEIPSLLRDISQTAQADGLQQNLFQPQAEIAKDFYAEKPIKIILSGNFHELAKFASDVAALPRIVTLHDIVIKPEKAGDASNLQMDVLAKTYRYLEDDQQ